MRKKQRMYLLNRPYIKRIFALFTCLMLLSSGIPAASAAEATNNRRVKAGVFFFDGYHMQDDDGTYSGYGIELLNLISQYSHLNFEFTGYDNTWAETQSMLLNGEIDVATSARKTRERTEIYLYSTPISLNNTVLTVWKGNTSIVSGDYSTYDGMTVGLLAGNSQNRFLLEFAAENGFTYQTKEYKDSHQLNVALQNGTIDAILTSNLRRMENERLLDTIKVDYFYAITRKDDQALMDEINYAIEQMNLYEGDWANSLYNKYYGTEVSVVNDFTRQEQDYIEAVALGEKRITATAMPDRKPYSYVEDGELKGILPQYFDRLMQMAGLSYEMIVPADRAEYDWLKENGGVDIVIDWHQTALEKSGYTDGGFLTDTYLNTGTALLTRRTFHGSVSSLAVAEDQKDLPLEYEQFKDASIQYYPAIADIVQAILDGETDAALMRTHSAQYFINNDRTNSLHLNIVDSDQTVFNMYVPNDSDHELVTILNKCIHQVPDDVLSRLITEYTASEPGNVSFSQYMYANPRVFFLLSSLVTLAVAAILFLYLRSRWNRKLLQTTEQANQQLEQANQKLEQAIQELEEQLAIVNALTEDLSTIYKVDLQAESVVALKMDQYMPSGMDWASGKAFPYTEALHRYIDEHIQEEDREELKTTLSLDNLRGELSLHPEHTGNYRVCLDGEMHNFQFVCVTYRTKKQTIPRVLIGFRNIDEIIRTEQEQKTVLEEALHMARAASEAKTAFLSSMSHDIRTPMNAIIGFLTLMRDEVNNPARVTEYIQRMDAAGQHMLSLINDILDMSKIESGGGTLDISELNLAEVIDGINTIIRPQITVKEQTFNIVAPRLTHERLLGDRLRINQILINLLSNAVKYTPEGGTIEMRVEELPQAAYNYSRVRFTIQDNGFGMSRDYLKIIFDPFTREERKTTYGIRGTGLGMPLTKNLVDMMGGSIHVESELDKGSTFTVELELRIQDEALRETDSQSETNDKPARMTVTNDSKQNMDVEIQADVVQGKRILVVDDIDVNRLILVKILNTLGAQCDTAVNGQEAVEKFETSRPDEYDLILMDLQMPVMDGHEAARTIRSSSHPMANKMPIIAVTANAFVDDMRRALESGMDAHIAKPIQIDNLKATIQQVLDKRLAVK